MLSCRGVCYFINDIYQSKFKYAISIVVPVTQLPSRAKKAINIFLEDPLTEIEWLKWKEQNKKV